MSYIKTHLVSILEYHLFSVVCNFVFTIKTVGLCTFNKNKTLFKGTTRWSVHFDQRMRGNERQVVLLYNIISVVSAGIFQGEQTFFRRLISARHIGLTKMSMFNKQ